MHRGRTISKFNKERACNLAYLSSLAYNSKSNINYNLTEYALTHVSSPETDTQGYIAVDDKDLFIVFRGSTNLDDWLTNLDTDFVMCGAKLNLEQHEGFYTAYKSVKEQISSVVKDNLDKNIYITGHSLGGALANLCAVDLHLNEGIVIEGMYSFGSPRVYSERSAAYINQLMRPLLHRVVNNNDVVAHVPPEFADYSHNGILTYIEESGELHTDENLSWWRLTQYSLVGMLSDIGEFGADSFKDHAVGDYYNYLQYN